MLLLVTTTPQSRTLVTANKRASVASSKCHSAWTLHGSWGTCTDGADDHGPTPMPANKGAPVSPPGNFLDPGNVSAISERACEVTLAMEVASGAQDTDAHVTPAAGGAFA